MKLLTRIPVGFLAALGICCTHAAGPEPVPLWPQGVPGGREVSKADQPDLRIYPADPSNATGACVVICPGGSYAMVAIDHEGQQPARWLNSIGITAIVLKYRRGQGHRHPEPLEDVQQALRYARAHAEDLQIDPHRVGVMGFSAGGHLASTISTHFDEGDPDSSDPLARESCRPDFAILCYPTISMKDAFGHSGSRFNLLGPEPEAELLESLSNQTQVTSQTPPTFLFHTADDAVVPVQNSVVYFQSLVKAGVPAELHIYQNGPHGVGLAPGDPVVGTWTDRLADWLKLNGFLSRNARRAAATGTVSVNGQPLRWGSIRFTPADDRNAPAAFAAVTNGKFKLEQPRGPVIGKNEVTIYSLGGFTPEPTIDDAQQVPTGDVAEPIVVTVTDGPNEFAVEVP